MFARVLILLMFFILGITIPRGQGTGLVEWVG